MNISSEELAQIVLGAYRQGYEDGKVDKLGRDMAEIKINDAEPYSETYGFMGYMSNPYGATR